MVGQKLCDKFTICVWNVRCNCELGCFSPKYSPKYACGMLTMPKCYKYPNC